MSYHGYKVHCITIDNSIHNSVYNTTNSNQFAYTEKEYIHKELEPYLKKIIDTQGTQMAHFHAIQGMGANLVKVAKDKGCKVIVTMHDWWWITPCFFLISQGQAPCNQREIDLAKCSTCIGRKDEAIKTFLDKRKTYLKQILIEDVDAIIAVSEYLKDYLIANHMPHHKIYVNKNGVELPLKQGRDRAEPLVFGFMGGMQEIKGYKQLIKAFSNLHRQDWELHIYGCLKIDEKGFKKVKNYIKERKFKQLTIKLWQVLKSRIKQQSNIKYYPVFTPEQKDEVYSQINVLLSLSQCKESSSLVVREALVRNIPVITTPSGGPQEVVDHGVNGMVLKDNSIECLVTALETFVDHKQYTLLKQKMKKAPYLYSYKEQVEAQEEIYMQAVNSLSSTKVRTGYEN